MHHVDANGLRFAYLSEGSGPLVLFVHGFPDTAYSWDRVMPAVAQAGFRAVAPFTRGYHPTEIPKRPDYGTDTLGRDILALIEALGEERAVVVGHDWGASAAYSAAALGPERVRLLVTLAIPHPRSVKPSLSILWSMRHFLALRGKGGAARLRKNDWAYLDELVRRWSPAWKDLPASETARVKESLSHPGSAEAACAYYAAVTTKLPASHREKIRVPTVSFAGRDDILPPSAYERARRCYESTYEVVEVPGGHFMHREHPEPFIAKLLDVLAR